MPFLCDFARQVDHNALRPRRIEDDRHHGFTLFAAALGWLALVLVASAGVYRIVVWAIGTAPK